MREIKFRVWNKDYKVMGYDPIIKDGKYFEIIGNDIWGTSDDYILMQYTGIKDANGKEIYEGDIVKETKVYDYSDDIDVNIYQIIWNENITGFTAEGKNGSNTIHQNNMGVCEVIGNIYENSNLLESENDNGE